MLASIHINNMAIIDQVSLEFHKGITGFTGEPGAGKSLLIDGVDFALGKNIPQIIRSYEKYVTVKLCFILDKQTRKKVKKAISFFFTMHPTSSESIQKLLQEEIPEKISIQRTLDVKNVDNTCFNDIEVPVLLVATLRPLLVEVTKQFEQTSLLDTKTYREIIDKYAGIEKTVARYAKIGEKLSMLHMQLEDAQMRSQDYRQQLFTLEEEKKYIEQLNITSKSEFKKVSGRVKILEAKKRALDLAADVAVALSGGGTFLAKTAKQHRTDYGQEMMLWLSGLMERLGSTGGCRMAKFFAKKLQNFSSQLGRMTENLENFVRSGTQLKQELQEERARLAELNEALEKYESWKHLCSRNKGILAEINDLAKAKNIADTLPKVIDVVTKQLIAAAQEIEIRRFAAAKEIKDSIQTYLRNLKMEYAQFDINVDRHTRDTCKTCICELQNGHLLAADGPNIINFMFSANAGEPMKNLQDIASGGELSRVLFALKCIMGQKRHIKTFIFDEIDTGTSGETTKVLAQKLRELADSGAQVLLVSHSPQIAKFVDHHFLVAKGINPKQRTMIGVQLLDIKGRIQEIGRIFDQSRLAAAEFFGVPKRIPFASIPDGITNLQVWRKFCKKTLEKLELEKLEKLEKRSKNKASNNQENTTTTDNTKPSGKKKIVLKESEFLYEQAPSDIKPPKPIRFTRKEIMQGVNILKEQLRSANNAQANASCKNKKEDPQSEKLRNRLAEIYDEYDSYPDASYLDSDPNIDLSEEDGQAQATDPSLEAAIIAEQDKQPQELDSNSEIEIPVEQDKEPQELDSNSEIEIPVEQDKETPELDSNSEIEIPVEQDKETPELDNNSKIKDVAEQDNQPQNLGSIIENPIQKLETVQTSTESNTQRQSESQDTVSTNAPKLNNALPVSKPEDITSISKSEVTSITSSEDATKTEETAKSEVTPETEETAKSEVTPETEDAIVEKSEDATPETEETAKSGVTNVAKPRGTKRASKKPPKPKMPKSEEPTFVPKSEVTPETEETAKSEVTPETEETAKSEVTPETEKTAKSNKSSMKKKDTQSNTNIPTDTKQKTKAKKRQSPLDEISRGL